MQVTTFTVCDLLLGLDVRDVQEILRPQEMTPVPLAPGAVEGLINLRGQIVTALDLRERIGLPPRERQLKDGGPARRPMNVVVRTGENATSLLVDTIGDVVDVEAETLEPPPDNLNATTRELVKGIHKLDGRLLLLLDLDRTLQEKGN
jgi:purine-binding chemotaxis protein CheW